MDCEGPAGRLDADDLRERKREDGKDRLRTSDMHAQLAMVHPTPDVDDDEEISPAYSIKEAIFPTHPSITHEIDTGSSLAVTPDDQTPTVIDDVSRSNLTMTITTPNPASDVPLITGQLLMSGAMAAAETIMDASVGVSKMLWTVANDVSQVPISFINRLSRPMLHERWASLSDFRVGAQPKLVTRIASYLPPSDVRRVRAVSRSWFESLDGMVRSSEVWVAMLDEEAVGKLGDAASVEALLMPFGLVGFYSTEYGRYVARFRPMDKKRNKFKKETFRGLRIAVPVVDPFGPSATLRHHESQSRITKRRSSLALLEDGSAVGEVINSLSIVLHFDAILPPRPTHQNSKTFKSQLCILFTSTSKEARRSRSDQPRPLTGSRLTSVRSRSSSLTRPSTDAPRPSLEQIMETKVTSQDREAPPTHSFNPSEVHHDVLKRPSETKLQSYTSHDLLMSDPSDSWHERRPYNEFEFRRGHHQAEIYKNVGHVCVHDQFLLQLDSTNRRVAEIDLPLMGQPMLQLWSQWRQAVEWKTVPPTPSSNPTLTALLSPARLNLILHYVSKDLEPLISRHLPPTPSLALRYTLSCPARYLPEAFYPIFRSFAGGESPILEFLRVWQAVEKRVEILVAIDISAARAIKESKEASAASARRLLEWIQAPIKEVAASMVDDDEERSPTKTVPVNRSVKVRGYCQEASRAFLAIPGGELYLRITGFGMDVGDVMAVYAHVSENLLSVLVRETQFEGSVG
ncbi:hypothetical protein HDU67_001561 [Dinochytrium kinnereticum]|nr:hypothetical protein HDU67_001561 [Dinochytrium kinnereticum]